MVFPFLRFSITGLNVGTFCTLLCSNNSLFCPSECVPDSELHGSGINVWAHPVLPSSQQNPTPTPTPSCLRTIEKSSLLVCLLFNTHKHIQQNDREDNNFYKVLKKTTHTALKFQHPTKKNICWSITLLENHQAQCESSPGADLGRCMLASLSPSLVFLQPLIFHLTGTAGTLGHYIMGSLSHSQDPLWCLLSGDPVYAVPTCTLHSVWDIAVSAVHPRGRGLVVNPGWDQVGRSGRSNLMWLTSTCVVSNPVWAPFMH